jgi:hypothetical protein
MKRCTVPGCHRTATTQVLTMTSNGYRRVAVCDVHAKLTKADMSKERDVSEP